MGDVSGGFNMYGFRERCGICFFTFHVACFLLVDDDFPAFHDVDTMRGVGYAAALEVVDGVVAPLHFGTDTADTCSLGFSAGGVEIDDEALGGRDGFVQAETGAVRFQFNGGSPARALLVETGALAAHGEDVVFVAGRGELLSGGSTHEEIARDVFLCARDVCLVGYGSARGALEYEARLLGNDFACAEGFHNGLVARRDAGDDVGGAACGNFKILVFKVVGGVAGGADIQFFTIIISITAP